MSTGCPSANLNLSSSARTAAGREPSNELEASLGQARLAALVGHDLRDDVAKPAGGYRTLVDTNIT